MHLAVFEDHSLWGFGDPAVPGMKFQALQSRCSCPLPNFVHRETRFLQLHHNKTGQSLLWGTPAMLLVEVVRDYSPRTR